MRIHFCVGLALISTVAAHDAQGQSVKAVSAQGSALYSGLSGDAYKNFKAGPGYEAQLRYTSTTGLSLGGGWEYTKHDVAGSSGGATLSGPFVEPRYAFEVKGSDRIFPYASLRLSFLKQDYSGNSVNTSASGVTANAGGGILFGITAGLNLDVGATFGLTNFSRFVTIDPATGQQVTGGKTGSGSNFVVRTGLAIGLF